MSYGQTELSYRKASLEGASSIGLVIALYDTLASDLKRAAEAIRARDIELRCRQLNHAALVLGQLEDWVDRRGGDKLADSLSAFYAYLRSAMLQAGLKQSAEMLEAQIGFVLQVRAAWQQRDAGSVPNLSPAPAAERLGVSLSA